MEAAYYNTKVKILALAQAFFDGDEATKSLLRTKADFFPVSKGSETSDDFRSLVIRITGQIFLIEDTPGGEKGVFALLLPVM